MSEELEPVQEDETLEVEQPEADPAPEVDPEVIERAKGLGWREKEKFDREPKNWVDAERYLELPQTQVKMLRDESRAKEREFQERFDALERSTKTATARVQEQERARYEDQLTQITTQQRDAVAVADVKTYEALEEQKRNLSVPQPEVPQQQSNPAPIVEQYRKENAWTQDPVMWEAAVQSVEMNPAIQQMSPIDQLAYAERNLRTMFPAKFATQETVKPAAARVDAGGLGAVSAKPGVNKLPPEARKVGQSFVEDGIYKNLEEYAADYFKENS